jgi:hypothetical protein
LIPDDLAATLAPRAVEALAFEANRERRPSGYQRRTHELCDYTFEPSEKDPRPKTRCPARVLIQANREAPE